MRGYGHLFVGACMALIAISAGAVLYFALSVAATEAALVSLSLLFAMLILEVVSTRRRDRAEGLERFEGLARVSTDIARQVGDLRHRVAALEQEPPAAGSAAPASELAHEIGELAQLVKGLAETIAHHEQLLAERARANESAAGTRAVSAGPPERAPSPFAGKSEDEVRALVQQALGAGRIDLYLQPVVTLPQRKVRYHEALSRMRLDDGTVIEARDFLPVARAAGLLPRIDMQLVQNCVQIVRRLAAKNREVGLFLNIAPETLLDRAIFGEISAYLDVNRALAASLVLEFPQSVYRGLPNAALENLARIAERGFRFSLDRIEDFRIDARGLAERGIRFMKVPAELLLRRVQQSGAQVHPADLSDLLGRFGIELVADHIESESIVVDLLDYDVRFGQGFLFSPPRPVRAEILRRDGEPVLPTVGNGVSADAAAAAASIARRMGEFRGSAGRV